MNKVYLLIGKITLLSSRYETAAWGFTEQPHFLNQAVLLQTDLLANDLMLAILNIEKSMGRERSIPLGPRIIDIDIIYFNEEIIDNISVTIPHPKMTARRFVLLPLVEIAPDYIHPILLKSNSVLLKECGDSLAVNKKTP